MKRSHGIQLVLVTSVAAALAGCNNRATRYCVDENQRATDDSQCRSGVAPAGYHWFYVGGARNFANGERVIGGSALRPSGGFNSRGGGAEGGTVRGGIGGAGEAASAHGGGGGE